MESIPCCICHSRDSRPLYRKGGLPISRCSQCGLVFANPRLSQEEIWQRYSANYFWGEYMPAHGAADGRFDAALHRRRNLPLLNLLQPFRQHNRLLEVGCAAGFFLRVASDEGWQATGVEIMEPAVSYARDRLGLDVRHGQLEQLDMLARTGTKADRMADSMDKPGALAEPGQSAFANGSFDAVVMVETVEHLLDPAGTLAAALPLLRPGGVLLLTVPNQNSIIRSLLGEEWSILSPAEHLYYFTATSLDRLLRQTGYVQTEFTWRLPGHSFQETMNPCNSHSPQSRRSQLVKRLVLTFGRYFEPLVIAAKRTDTLIALAVR